MQMMKRVDSLPEDYRFAFKKIQILEVTGEDVAGFCHEFLRDTKKWADKYSEKLNRDILNKTRRGK
ncbi:MAG: DUF1048 domain-containing protein [Clostridiales bacterium]|nr:DUF1048 domain-containing protein [Clostridiales bacterium]